MGTFVQYYMFPCANCNGKIFLKVGDDVTKGYDQRKKSNKKYLEKFDEIKVRVPNGEKGRIKLHAEGNGESMNAFIIRAINETMERDNSEIEPVSYQEYLQSVKRIIDRNRAEREERKKKKGE